MDTVTQEDISMFQTMFSKLSNIIVQASEVGQRLPVLQSQIEQLTHDCETVRQRNKELDEELFNVRNQRDIAQQEARQAQAEASSRLAVIEANAQEINNLHTTVGTLTTDLSNARKDRDDHAYKCLELQEQLDKAHATLAKFKALLGDVFPTEPKPEPVPTVTEPDLPVVVEAPPSPSTRRVYRYADWSEYNNAVGERQWDADKLDYYIEVAA